MARSASVVLAFALAMSLVARHTAHAGELDDLLKRPVSPGTLGLMATHSKDPRVGIRWREALSHSSPQVRAAAARLLLVSGNTDAIPALHQMLETDTDPGAALEAARALLIMATGSTEAAVVAAAQRLKTPGLAKVLGEERGPGAVAPAPAQNEERPFGSGESASFRTVAELPQGYVEDVLKVTRCKPSDEDAVVGAVVRYNKARHLQELRWASTMGAPCAKAGRAILIAGLLPAPAAVTAGKEHWIVLPVGRTFLQCLASTATWRTPVNVGTFAATAPRKVKHVNPTYPPKAINERRQGLVILKATTSESGCIREISVLKNAGLDLDIEAIRTVSQWAFTSYVRDGVPEPVAMTVTVSFTLTK